jgi:hypothetical protein
MVFTRAVLEDPKLNSLAFLARRLQTYRVGPLAHDICKA